MHPVIDTDACVGCGVRVDECPMDVLEINDDGVCEATNADECVGCGACLNACPAGAITDIADD